MAHAVAVLAALVAAVVVDALAHAAVALVHARALVVAAAVAVDVLGVVQAVRPAVHVQTYVLEDALAHAMQDAATAVRHLVCHRVRVHVLRLAQGSRRYQLLLIKERYRYVTFVREIGNISDNFVRFARISQNIDDFGDQIVIVLSKDEYKAIPEGYGAEE